MKPRRYDGGSPRAEELAAYVDGELTEADQQRIEDWLAEHPEAAAEVNSLMKLDCLLQAHTPHEPAEAEWAAVLQRIEQGMIHRERVAQQTKRNRFWVAMALGAGAAAILLALVLNMKQEPQVAHQPTEPAFPVVADDDIEITSVDAADAHALAIGEFPLRANVVLVSAGDVALRSVESDPQWGFPDMHMQTDGNETPMIYAPLLAADIKLP